MKRMLSRCGLLLGLLLVLIDGSALRAQVAADFIAPQVFLRGIQIASGTRYTAAIVKTPENAALHSISVEITLPASAELAEMIVPRQVDFDVIRRNRAGQLTLIWQIAHLDPSSPLEPYSFTLVEPLTEELEFYVQWNDDAGSLYAENFLELPPPPIVATQSQAAVELISPRFTLIENMGVQAAAPDETPLHLDVTLLSADFNPPPQYGDFWWCSLLDLRGVPAAKTVQVIVPLRRPLAPFTLLGMFQQQADGTWSPLTEQGVVTADGQYVMYSHPGGVIATGTEAEAQPDLITTENLVIVDAPLPTQGAADGTSNTIIIGEATNTPAGGAGDGTSNTIIIGEATNTPAGGVGDGTSNTIIIGEATNTPAGGAGGAGGNTLVPTATGGSGGTGGAGGNTPTASATGESGGAGGVTPIASATGGSGGTGGAGGNTPTASATGESGGAGGVTPIASATGGSGGTGGAGGNTPTASATGESGGAGGVTPIASATGGSGGTGGAGGNTLVPTATGGGGGAGGAGGNTLVPTETPSPLPDSVAVTATETLTLVPTETPSPLPDSVAATATETLTLVPTETPSPLPDSVAATATETLTLVPTETPSPLPDSVAVTATETPSLTATLVLQPTRSQFTPNIWVAFGDNTPKIVLLEVNGVVLQCQVGEINCAAPIRREGTRLF